MGHEVTHSCGHTEQHTIYGHFAADVDRQLRQLTRRKCGPCYKAGNEAKAISDAALLEGMALPELTGSEKQVSWATTIRTERLALLHRGNPGAVANFVAIVEAKWWIDNRKLDLRKASPPAQPQVACDYPG